MPYVGRIIDGCDVDQTHDKKWRKNDQREKQRQPRL